MTTRPRDNARLYTYYPRKGDHARAHLRRALLTRRNVVESIRAQLRERGLAGREAERAAWAEDQEMAWLLGTALLGLTARRVAWESGAYDFAYAEVDELGLLNQPSTTDPVPGPDELTLNRALRRRDQVLGEPQPPRSLTDNDADAAAA